MGKRKQDEFRRYDTNHDGKVTREEFQKGRFWGRLLQGPSVPTPKPLPWLREVHLAETVDKVKNALREAQ